MNPNALPPPPPNTDARRAGKPWLAAALKRTRQLTLRLAQDYAAALGPQMRVPLSPELNPPLWELGHIAWFADWWIARNPQRVRGVMADPCTPRFAARQAAHGLNADALYNSSEVPHDSRWQMPLPDLEQTHQHLADSLAQTLALLKSASDDDAGLYFFRLVLFHEAMHAEAAVYMAQNLGIAVDTKPRAAPAHATHPTLKIAAQTWTLGSQGPGFVFDNECEAHSVELAAFEIDSQPVSWARYLVFIDAGGYENAHFWSPEGWAWREAQGAIAPRYLRAATSSGSGWERLRFGTWHALDLREPARHLSAFEAQAWCSWAGRRLPTEAEWECAALSTTGFDWGRVWEWTASPFAPFPGFTPHPYRDYSQPWFDGRPVLRGASPATPHLMRNPKFRNYFTPDRNDVFAGFRSVAER